MHISSIHARMVKSVKINQEWNEVKDVTTEIGNVHPPTHPEFVIVSVNQDRHNRVTHELLSSKLIISLKSAAYNIQFTTQKVMQMETFPLMHKYNPNINTFTK